MGMAEFAVHVLLADDAWEAGLAAKAAGDHYSSSTSAPAPINNAGDTSPRAISEKARGAIGASARM